MKTQKAVVIAYASLAIVVLLWSGNAIVGRAVRNDVPPFTLAFVRWVGAFLIVTPFAARHLAVDWPALKRHAGMVLLLGVLGVGAFNALLYTGLHYTSAANGLLLQAAAPAAVLLFNRLLFSERAPMRQIIGVTLSTLGVVVVVLRGDVGLLLGLTLGLGDLIVLGSAIVWALYASLLRLTPAVHPMSFLAVTFLVGVVCMAPLAAAEWAKGGFPALTPQVIGAFAYVAVLPSVVAYLLFNAAVAEIGAAKASQAISLVPLVGAGISSVLLSEPLHLYHFWGMVMIVVGIVLGARGARMRNEAHSL
jgi:drug/metabolite transporter (DMT)-like permease